MEMSRNIEEKSWIWEKMYSGEFTSGDGAWPLTEKGMVMGDLTDVQYTLHSVSIRI